MATPYASVILGITYKTRREISGHTGYYAQNDQRVATNLTHKNCNYRGIMIARFEASEIQRSTWARLRPVMTDARRASEGTGKNAAKNSGVSGGQTFWDLLLTPTSKTRPAMHLILPRIVMYFIIHPKSTSMLVSQCARNHIF